MNWQFFRELLKAYFEQALRLSQLEARVAELERELRAGAPFVRPTIIPAPMPANIFGLVPNAEHGSPPPLGFTLYERGRDPLPFVFEQYRRSLFFAATGGETVGVDVAKTGDDSAVRCRLVIYDDAERERPGAPTRVRVLSVERIEKESPDRATSEPEEA